MAGLVACGAAADDEMDLGSTAEALSPGAYRLIAPALDGYPCTEIVTVTVTVAADGSSQADA